MASLVTVRTRPQARSPRPAVDVDESRAPSAWHVVPFLLLAACGADGSTPGWIVLPGMVQSTAHEAFDTHPTLGQTLRLPPAGTVPYGSDVAGNPYAGGAVPKDELALGKKTFDIYCQVCHGPAGVGDGPIIGRFPNPPSLLADRARGLSDDQMYSIISNGQGLMPGYALQVLERDRWRAVAYVRWLQSTPEGTP